MANDPKPSVLSPPRIERLGALTVVGVSSRMYPGATTTGASIWQKFGAVSLPLPGQVSKDVAYGVCSEFSQDRSFLYTAGVAVSESDSVPDGLTVVALAPATYAAVFVDDHIGNVAAAWGQIYSSVLPQMDLKPAAAPPFERYDRRFDPATGRGGYEIWIPVEA